MVEIREYQPRVLDGEVIRLELYSDPIRTIANRCSKCHAPLNIAGARPGDRNVMVLIKPHTCPTNIVKDKYHPNLITIHYDVDSTEYKKGIKELTVCTKCSSKGGSLIKHNCSNEVIYFHNVHPLNIKVKCERDGQVFEVNSKIGKNFSYITQMINCPKCSRSYAFDGEKWYCDRELTILSID